MNKSSKLNLIALILIAIWVSYYLAVLLKTGFISDDAYNSQVKGAMLQDGVSLFQKIYSETMGWITGVGRFFPLGYFYTYTLYYLTQSEILIKSMTLIVILIGVVSFAAFVKNETNSWVAGLLAGLTIPVFFQFRNWHDPLIAFTALIPLLFMCSMGALVLFQKYIESRKKYQLYTSLLLYLLALLTYEISYPLGVLFLIVAYSHLQNIKQAIKISWLHLFLSAFFIGLMFTLRAYFLYSHDIQSDYPGAELHANLGKVLQTFIIQISASFPLSFYFSTKEQFKLLLSWSDLIFISTFFVGTCCLIIIMAREKINPPPRLSGLLMAGTSLLILPALVMSFSGHQDEFIAAGFGMGYIQIYFQYFGLCLMLIVGLIYISRKLPSNFVVTFAFFIALGLSIIATINLGLNRTIATGTHATYLYPRKLLEEALKAGILDEVNVNSLVLRNGRFPSDNSWFYTTVTGRKFNICSLNSPTEYTNCLSKFSPTSTADTVTPNFPQTYEIVDLNQREAWIQSYTFDRELGQTGQLVLGKISRIIQNKQSKTPLQIVVNKVLIYQQTNGKIHSLNLEKSPIDFLKISNFENQHAPSLDEFSSVGLLASDVDYSWVGGIFPFEGSEQNNVRWSSGKGELILYNFSNKMQAVKMSMALGIPGPDSARVSIQHPKFQDTVNTSQNQVNYSKVVLLPPGETVVKFTSDGKPLLNGDPRKIVFGIFNFTLSKIKDDIDSQ